MIVISRNSLAKAYYFIFAFVFLPPASIEIIPNLNTFHITINIVACVMALIIIGLNIIESKAVLSNSLIGILTILTLWIAISNVINQVSTVSIIRNLMQMVRIIGLCAMIERSFRREESESLLYAFYQYSIVIIIANLLSQIIYGKDGLFHSIETGWQSIYVLGNDNRFSFFFIFAATIVTVTVERYNKNRIIIMMFYVFMIWTAFISRSDAAKTIVIILLVSYVLSIINISKIIEGHSRLLIVLLLIGIVYFVGMDGWKRLISFDVITGNFDYYSILDRGRVWTNTAAIIMEQPIFGYGSNTYQITTSLTGARMSAHNTFLQLGLVGGIPAVVIFLMTMFSPFKYYSGKRVNFIYIVGLLAFILTFIVEQNIYDMGFYSLLSMILCEGLYSDDKIIWDDVKTEYDSKASTNI